MDPTAALADLFPIASASFTLECISTSEGSTAGLPSGSAGPLVVTLRLVTSDDDDDALTQDLDLVYPMHRDDPRVPAYLTGWASALRSLLARRDELELVGARPHRGISPWDLVHPGVLYATHLVTAAQFEHALLFAGWRLGRLLPDQLDVPAAFAEQLPIAVGDFTLELVPETVDEATGEVLGGFHEGFDLGLHAVLRLSLRDSSAPREASVCVARSEHAHDLRLPTYFAGWALALRTLFARHAALDAEDPRRAALIDVDPSALVCPGVLALQRPHTAEAFAAALLADKRLGRLR